MATISTPRTIRRGQIWLIEWSPGRGSEQLGRRPALVVQNDAGNSSVTYPNTIVVAMSTKGKLVPMHVAIRKSSRNGLREDSFVKCEQIMTIDKGRLIGKPWGALDAAEMAAVDAALRRSIGLN